MNGKLCAMVVAGFVGLVASASQAAAGTIDFESTPTGIYSSLDYGDLVITFTGGNGLFDVLDSGSPGAPISVNAITAYYQQYPSASPFRATFAGHATTFSIGVGDYDGDDDNTFLVAYDDFGAVIDSDYYFNPASTYGGSFLTVSGAGIKYVEFWDEEPFPSAVYWDNIRYEATSVPLPSSALMGLGALGVIGGLAARKRRKSSPAL